LSERRGQREGTEKQTTSESDPQEVDREKDSAEAKKNLSDGRGKNVKFLKGWRTARGHKS